MIGIYKITSPSGKIYIGQSVNLESRINLYKYNNCKKQIRLYNSFQKYGAKNHISQIIKECIVSDLNQFERFYQDFYKCIGENGLNCILTKTNDKSGYWSKETLLKRKQNCENKNRVKK